MASYRRFITYLFRYENGEKKEQMGYVKVEQRQNVGKIDVYLKNCSGDVVEIRPYFFAKGIRVPIGTISIKNRVATGSFRLECHRLGGKELNLDEVRGIWIPISEREIIFSQWDDGEYSWEELKWEQPEFEESCGEEEDIAGKENVCNEAEEPRVEEQVVCQQLQEKSYAAERLLACRPRFFPFDGNRDTWAVQIQPGDVKNLPEKYWDLSKNSFVLRGYFKYGKILLVCRGQEKGWLLGVPGVYHRQEKVIAGMFGFTDFYNKEEKEVQAGSFGYWCMPLAWE